MTKLYRLVDIRALLTDQKRKLRNDVSKFLWVKEPYFR